MGNEWAVHVVWAGSCGLPLGPSFFIGPNVARNNIFSSMFKRVCKLNFKFQICKKLNLFDMINFELKAH